MSNFQMVEKNSLEQNCYQCGKAIEILTYIKYETDINEDLTFPWDKKRLNRDKSFQAEFAHMRNPDIEYYPILIIGSNSDLDQVMLEYYPDRIK